MPLEIGQLAPEFTLRSQHGEEVALAGFRHRQAVIVMFYPFAFSSVCTGELGEIRDHLDDLADESTALVAISCDPMYTLRAFADRDGYAFPLLSDFWPHGAVATSYDVFNAERGCAGRATFIVDRAGVLRWQVHNEMPQARDLADYGAALAELH